MKLNLRNILGLLSTVVLSLSLAACDNEAEDKAEDMGDKIEDTTNDVGEGIEDTTEDMGDAAEDAVN